MKLLKTQIFEKSYLSSEKTIFAYFSSFYRVWETLGDILYLFKRFSDIYCGSYWIISLTLLKLLKTQISEKKLSFQRKKYFRLFLLVLSSVINLTKQCIGVHKLFWHLLWNFWQHFFRTWEVVGNKIYWKKGDLSFGKDIAAFFLS